MEIADISGRRAFKHVPEAHSAEQIRLHGLDRVPERQSQISPHKFSRIFFHIDTVKLRGKFDGVRHGGAVQFLPAVH